MNDSRLNALHALLTSLAPLPDSEWQALTPALHPTKFAPGDSLLRIGDPPFKAAFVCSGLLKSFYLTTKGAEYIRGFSGENSLVVSFTAILQGLKQSDINVVALEPSELVVFDFAAYQSLIPRHWTWQQIGRKFAEQHYVLRERRQYELLTMGAEQRFEMFKERFPELVGRISQRDLAGYIGITPVSLSRLRAQRK